jgi:DNA-binding PadR family transcriptional regulator
MSTADLVLALLAGGPAHGYDLKRAHDDWFPGSRPVAFGQIYATLGRLLRSGLVEVVETRVESGPERTVYALSSRGRRRLRDWLAEPAEAAPSSAGELVGKTVAAVHTGADAGALVARQRDAHVARMRELTGRPPAGDVGAQLAHDHVVAHLDADLRWLETALERVGAQRGVDDSHTAS